MSEYRLHLAVLAHINSAFIGAHNPNLKVWHTPNSQIDSTQAYWNKTMGVIPGIPDLLFAWPKHMGALELKVKHNKLSSAQNKVMSWAKIIGWHTGEARTVRAAHMVLCSWGLKAGHSSIMEPDYSTFEDKKLQAYEMYKPL